MLDDKVTRIKIADHFYERYGAVLKYPLLPALQAGSDTRPMYFPMEVFLFYTFPVYVSKFCIMFYVVLDLKSVVVFLL